ncbi:MAG TPA: MG2 domain-containing protein, partial [Thermoanaerobaculia bacterium]|nr:MG2 domain-containing protein [Thermoanaerobaculia bacterium]
MSEEQREGKVTRSNAERHGRERGKDVVIVLLVLALLGMTGFAFRARIARAWGRSAAAPANASGIKVFDVVVDRKNRSYVDFLFDRAVAGKRVGEVLPAPPATVEPSLGGVWRWQGPATLRFEPSGGFTPASRYRFDLIPERLFSAGEQLAGDHDFTVKIDRFFIRQVAINEEQAPGQHQVLFRGSIDFNYPVDPEALAPLIHLIDPRLGADHPLAVNLETSWRSKTIAFRTAAVEKTPEPRKLTLVVDGTLTPAAGNAPLGAPYRREIALGSSRVLEVRRIDPHPALGGSSMMIDFSSPVSAGVAEKYVSVTPSVPYRVSSDGNRLTLNGDFEAGETYAVHIATGLPAEDQAALNGNLERDVHFANLAASADFADQGMFLSALGAHRIALETVNVSQVSLVVERVFPSNLFDLFEYGSLFGDDSSYSGARIRRSLGDRLAEKTLAVSGPRNRRNRTVIDLDRYLPKGRERNGLFRVAVGQPGNWQTKQRWLLLTDLGAVAKVAPREAEVWVTGIRTLDPVADARVTVYSSQNQRLGAATTGAQGLARIPLPELPSGVAPYWATVRTSSDFTFVLFDRMRVDTADLPVGGAELAGAEAGAYQADLYGERDLYRPGERVHGMAVVRTAGLGLPPRMPVVLRHRDPEGHIVGSQRLMLDRHGAAEFSLGLPAYSLTGRHTLELVVAERVIGQYRFSVEEFVPDRIEVAVKPPEHPVAAGQTLSFNVQSRYLFGPPASGLAVETRVRVGPAPFAPSGYSGYHFGNPGRTFDAREVLAREGKLDEQGGASFTVPLPTDWAPPAALTATLFARVQETGGRGVAAVARVPVYPYPYYIGLKRAGGEMPSAGKPVRFDWLALAPDGHAASAGRLRLELYEDRYNTVLRRTPSGGFRYESKREPRLIESREIEAGEKNGSFEVTPPGNGEFRVVLSDPETRTSSALSFSAGGWGYAPWAMANPSRIDLILDRKEYRPGETATLEVKAPFAGRMLVTLERDRVLWSKVVTVEGNSARLTLPVPAALRPNGYVTATLVRKLGDLTEGSVGRAFGAVPIDVDRAAHHLEPEISAPATSRSGRKVDIEVRTRPGALVTIAAVDEGILQL